MSAKDDIHDRIHGPGYCDPPCGLCREVGDLLDAYAHELAEKQRDFMRTGVLSIATVIDLIDPEVTRPA